MLHGKKVRLREVRRPDLPQLREWRNERGIQKNCRQYRPVSELAHERWFERISAAESDQLMFVVEVDENYGKSAVKQIPIGVVGLCYWNRLHRSAEISFFIGNERFRGRGLCSDALRTLMAYGFEDLGLHRIWAEVYEFNEKSRDLLLNLGMKCYGIMPDTLFRFGKWHGSAMLSISEIEWWTTREAEASEHIAMATA